MRHVRSALGDAFQDNLLGPPLYTRPAVYKGYSVPEDYEKGTETPYKDGDTSNPSLVAEIEGLIYSSSAP